MPEWCLDLGPGCNSPLNPKEHLAYLKVDQLLSQDQVQGYLPDQYHLIPAK
jgi:hypothetical protein